LRDIAITLIIFGILPFVFRSPWVGALLFLWISIMTPHRMAFGFAHDFPFAALTAVVTLIGMLTTKEHVEFPVNATTLLLIIFPLWMCVTYAFALEQADGYDRWVEVMKIFFFVLISASLFNSRKHIDWLIWVIVFSVGFFGIKGGIFTIVTGGSSRVYGPPGSSFMSDNNAISVALVMIIPLMHYLRTITTSPRIRLGLLGAMLLSGVAVLGTHSRGAFLAIGAMILFLWLKSHKKLLGGLLILLVIPIAIGFMPDTWKDRMRSIENYEQDTSAMGRINAWQMAINVANDRPLIGGGFELYTPRTFAIYGPNPQDVHAAHSVYFQMLGEHGYVGLAIFLALCITSWLTARRVIEASHGIEENTWASELAKSIQISLIGFAVGGAFVNIGYWELFYYELIVLMVVHRLVTSRLSPQRSVT
jgi:putative inorganic carbon (hco3(-)) transporter